MFAAPPSVTTEIFAQLPESLKIKNRESEFVRTHRGGVQAPGSFLEGPSFDRGGNLYVTDLAYSRILRVTPDARWEVAAEYEGVPNGLKIHKDGSIRIADRRWGIMKMDPADGRVEPFCRGYQGEPFLGVNDLCFDHHGNLFFTDQGASDLRHPIGRIFRLRPSGELDLLVENLPAPNGLVVTADGSALLFAVTRANAIWRLPFRPDGSLGRMSIFIQMSGSEEGGPDGLALDDAGNLAVAHAFMGSSWLFDKFGEPLLRMRSCTGTAMTNLAYGGPGRKAIYITESHSGCILKCEMPVAGLPMYAHQ